ncbi:DUF3857 domain-containing protein [Gracilimonas sp.]|uniref:DUF3857 domain-containing protein n=1 Tax=Gracilimonas sp. TaxID=1974203 RepID=UPI0032EBACB1
MKNIILLTLLLFSFDVSYAFQQVYDFGDVPKHQLEMTVYENDSTAKAVVLFDKGETFVEYYNEKFHVKFKRHIRIKILTDEGLDLGEIGIRYRTTDPEQDVKKINAQTYNLEENGKVSKEDIGRRDVYKEKISDNWSEEKFSLPNLKKGSVFEYEYELWSNHPVDFPDWFFQREIPVLWSEYTTNIPEWFSYLSVKRGFQEYHSTDKSTHVGFVRIGNRSESVMMNKHFYAMKNLPAIRPEPYMKATVDYLSHVRFQLSSFTSPDGYVTNFLSTWPELSQELLDDGDFGKRLESSRKLKAAVNNLITDGDSDLEKVQKIFDHISEVMVWNERTSIYAFEDLEDAYESSSGNSGTINLILIQMLREAGLKSYPVILSTRMNGEIIKLFPLVSQFNHTIAYVEVDDRYYLLDANNEKRPFNLLPATTTNGEGLLIHEGSPIWINIDNAVQHSMIKLINLTIDETGGYEGDLSARNEGFFAMADREKMDSTKTESIESSDFFNADGINIDTMVVKQASLTEPYSYEIEFHKNGQDSVGIIYLNPMITDRVSKNPFKLQERTYPVEYDYPFNKRLIVNIIIPEGWKVDEIPQSVLHALPSQDAHFQRIVQTMGNTISFQYIFNVKKKKFMPEEYQKIKDMYEDLVTRHSENIVLKKEI